MMNIIGIGTDLVSIDRIEKLWREYGPRFANRILTPYEIQDLADSNNPAHFLAKRYAGKEALAKALGTGFQPEGILLTEISILNDDLGRPYLSFLGNTGEILRLKGVKENHISLSDEKHYAIAFVILLG